MASQVQTDLSSIEIITSGSLQVVQRLQEQLDGLVHYLKEEVRHLDLPVHVDAQLGELKAIVVPISENVRSIEESLQKYKAEQEEKSVRYGQFAQWFVDNEKSYSTRSKKLEQDFAKLKKGQKKFSDSRAAAKAEMEAKDLELKSKDDQLKSKDQELADLRTRLAAKNEECEKREGLMQKREEHMLERERLVLEREKRMTQTLADCRRTFEDKTKAGSVDLSTDLAGIRSEIKERVDMAHQTLQVANDKFALAASTMADAKQKETETHHTWEKITEEKKGVLALRESAEGNLKAAKKIAASYDEFKQRASVDMASIRSEITKDLKNAALFWKVVYQAQQDLIIREANLQSREDGFLKVTADSRDLVWVLTRSRELAEEVFSGFEEMNFDPMLITAATNDLEQRGEAIIDGIRQQVKAILSGLEKKGQMYIVHTTWKSDAAIDAVEGRARTAIDDVERAGQTSIDGTIQQTTHAIKRLQRQAKATTATMDELVEDLRRTTFSKPGKRPHSSNAETKPNVKKVRFDRNVMEGIFHSDDDNDDEAEEDEDVDGGGPHFQTSLDDDGAGVAGTGAGTAGDRAEYEIWHESRDESLHDSEDEAVNEAAGETAGDAGSERIDVGAEESEEDDRHHISEVPAISGSGSHSSPTQTPTLASQSPGGRRPTTTQFPEAGGNADLEEEARQAEIAEILDKIVLPPGWTNDEELMKIIKYGLSPSNRQYNHPKLTLERCANQSYDQHGLPRCIACETFKVKKKWKGRNANTSIPCDYCKSKNLPCFYVELAEQPAPLDQPGPRWVLRQRT